MMCVYDEPAAAAASFKGAEAEALSPLGEINRDSGKLVMLLNSLSFNIIGC